MVDFGHSRGRAGFHEACPDMLQNVFLPLMYQKGDIRLQFTGTPLALKGASANQAGRFAYFSGEVGHMPWSSG